MFGGLEPRVWRAREREPITGVWGQCHQRLPARGSAPGEGVRGGGAKPPEAESSLAFESPADEQNVSDSVYSVYFAAHTGGNHKAYD